MMRISTLALAIGLGFAAPLMVAAPATAQSLPTAQGEQSLEQQILAAANDPAALRAIITAELGLGNADSLAIALSKVAASIAATDTAGAATLVSQAVTAAEFASSDTQATVGGVASAVATTAAESGDTASAAAVATAVASSGGSTAQSYSNAGGSTGSNVNTSTAVVVATSTPTQSMRPPTSSPIIQSSGPSLTTASDPTATPVVPVGSSPNPAVTILAPPIPPQGQVAVNAQQGNPSIPQIGGGSNSSPS